MIGTNYFSVEEFGDVTVVRFVDVDDFDLGHYAQLKEDLAAFVADRQPDELLVDLGNVQYCSSDLTNTLLLALKHTRARSGSLKLFGLSEPCLETLKRLRLVGTLFSVYASETAARKACSLPVHEIGACGERTKRRTKTVL